MAIGPNAAKHFQGYLNSIVTSMMMACVVIILATAIRRWLQPDPAPTAAARMRLRRNALPRPHPTGAVRVKTSVSAGPSNTTQIFIGLLLGIAIGYLWPSSDVNGTHMAGFGEQIKPLADTFLRMIKMIIAPLLFSTLVVGIAGTGDLKAMGRIGLKAIIYFEVATTIALFLGLGIVNFFQPGVGVQAPSMSTDSLKGVQSIQAHTGWDMLVSHVPDLGDRLRWREATSCSSSCSRSSSASASRPSAKRASPCSRCSRARRR